MNFSCYSRLTAAFWLTLAIVSSASAVALQQPNMLFILADDMGWQDTSVPFGPERTAWNDRYQTPALGCGSYYGQQNFGAKAHPNGPWRAWDLDHYFGQDIQLTEALTLEAKHAIREAVAAKTPFFCYFAHYAPHTPIQPDERFAPKYRAAGLDEAEAAYASLIEGLDKSVGDLLALLDELGIEDNTIVVFTSDNGGVSHAYRSMAPPHTHNSPLSSGKGSHYEGGIRVPLLVRWPGGTEPATTCNTPVMIYDWFPTLLKAAGCVVAARTDGLDLAPLLRGETPNTFDRPLVWHFPNFWGPLNAVPVAGPGMGPSSTIRRGDWKLVYYHADQRFELFHLAEDLSEQHNLAFQKPQRVREMAAELTRILQQHRAPMPIVKSTGDPVLFPSSSFDCEKTQHERQHDGAAEGVAP